jgi:RNA polymerase-binding protein DksA
MAGISFGRGSRFAMTLDLAEMREELETERERLRGAIEAVNHTGSLADETGDLSIGQDDHIADSASETFMRELDDGLEENAEHLLGKIEAALQRIDDGTYGTCSVCGREIPEDRLQAVPYAALCLDDARAGERV